LSNHFSPPKNISGPVIIDDSLTPVNLEPDKKIIQPPARNKSFVLPSSLRDVTLRIVPDNVVDSTDVPTVDDADQKDIGTKNMAGDAAGDMDPGPPAGDGRGKDAPQPAPDASAEVLTIAEVMPEFPGGMAALQRFLSRNLKTPKDDMDPGAMVRVLARFVVDKDGSITGIKIEQSGGTDFDNEVSRVIKKMPAWKPGKQNGRNVSVYFNIPVIFQTSEN
jgi:protein TonB